MASRGIDIERGDVHYPKYRGGEDLRVLVREDGFFRFQSSSCAYIDADNVVYVEDWV
jgi:hypothetical protein